MSAVDVLEILAATVRDSKGDPAAHAEAKAVRNAVAELIAAATLARNALDATGARGGAFNAVDAALAAMGAANPKA